MGDVVLRNSQIGEHNFVWKGFCMHLVICLIVGLLLRCDILRESLPVSLAALLDVIWLLEAKDIPGQFMDVNTQ